MYNELVEENKITIIEEVRNGYILTTWDKKIFIASSSEDVVELLNDTVFGIDAVEVKTNNEEWRNV
jgi:hypothetical protein